MDSIDELAEAAKVQQRYNGSRRVQRYAARAGYDDIGRGFSLSIGAAPMLLAVVLLGNTLSGMYAEWRVKQNVKDIQTQVQTAIEQSR